jgi:preprotein translocase subunit YajC
MHLLAILAAAESSDDGGSGAAGLVQIGILLLIPLAMYFLMIRPQRRRMREQQAMQSSLEVGDEVMTASGIYGFITGFEEDRVWVEIDDDVQIRVNRGFLQGKVNTSDAPAATAEPASGKVTPTVKGLKPGKGSKAGEADTANGSTSDADPADRTTSE